MKLMWKISQQASFQALAGLLNRYVSALPLLEPTPLVAKRALIALSPFTQQWLFHAVQ